MISVDKGKLAEKIALWFLRFKGYRCVKQNYKSMKKTGAGEIDLIMRKKNILCFVEVKFRKTISQCAEAVSAEQQQRIIMGSLNFLQKNPLYRNCVLRYDVVWIFSYHLPIHLKGAFRVL